ncbi:hypothetical protein [Hymenobacter sp. 102]|uniref:hypothetical protein n=1 Tax=Hymenobacter sp. 102 TaxID=3403152 RepID=UPI003CF67086
MLSFYIPLHVISADSIINTTRWAVWTIVLGALLSLVLPWALTHFHSGISFAETGPIGDTIGGITGPVLNFTGLLVVYFSLREQFLSNQIQIQHFAEEQGGSGNVWIKGTLAVVSRYCWYTGFVTS